MTQPRSLLFLALSIALATTACTAGTGEPSTADGEEQETASAKTLLEAKLYDDPRATPDPFCDRYTHMKLTKARSGALAIELEERLSPTSACEIFVAPNPRKFAVTESESCGSTVYEGARGAASVRLQDNRTRLCEDLRPSVLELEETLEGGARRALYGAPLPASGGADPAPVSKVLDVKLYPEPRTQPDPFCDHYVKLVIGAEGSKLIATLQNELSPTSACEIAIIPDPRTYELTESESCGSKVYEGASGGDELRVQDNRTRLCEDLRPAVVEVTETRARGSASYFGAP